MFGGKTRFWVNQRLPSGPVVMLLVPKNATGGGCFGSGNSVTVPGGLAVALDAVARSNSSAIVAHLAIPPRRILNAPIPRTSMCLGLGPRPHEVSVVEMVPAMCRVRTCLGEASIERFAGRRTNGLGC